MSGYNFTIKLGTQNYTIEIDERSKYGYFEHNELGDESAGGLWFDNNLKLSDYDGVACLPDEVAMILYRWGYILNGTLEDWII